MSKWSDEILAGLDARAEVVETARGPIQVGREGSGPPVLVLHGGPGGFDQGLAHGRHLRDEGFELIAPSRPGYLRTPLSSGRTPAEQADLYAALLDALEIERVTVLGLSSGGTSSVHFAARHPDRVSALLLDSAVLYQYDVPMNAIERFLVFSSFGARLWPELAKRWPKLAARLFVDGMSSGLDKHQVQKCVDFMTSDESRVAEFREGIMSMSLWSHREAGFNTDEENEVALDPLPFEAVEAPTLLTHGLADGVVPLDHAKRAREELGDAHLVLIEEGHHVLAGCPAFQDVQKDRLAFIRSAH